MIYVVRDKLDKTELPFNSDCDRIIIPQRMADEIIRRMAGHVKYSYPTLHAQLEYVLGPLNVEVKLDVNI